MKPGLILAAMIIAGSAAAGTYVLMQPPSEPVPSSSDFDTSASTEERLLALERALADEREARQLLETELFALIETVDDRASERTTPATVAAPAEPQRAASSVAQFREARRSRNDPEARADFLVDQGFSADRAQYIASRESELRYEMLQAQWEARRNGEDMDWRSSVQNVDLALRADLGTSEYEQYLQANNRPTSITVNGVLQSSPAETAGLQSGDQITHYNGERVYSVWDINRLVENYDGSSPIVVEVDRGGVPMQVSLPPGPIGITGGRAARSIRR
ncbi:MAG: PDZ domain-containing protein [Pseudomonadota bacterium]